MSQISEIEDIETFGTGFTTVVTSAEVDEQPFTVFVTEKVPAVDTVIEVVVSPVDH